MLKFHEQNGVTVMAAGLGLPKVIAALVRMHSAENGLVLLLSTSEAQRQALVEEIQELDSTASLPEGHQQPVHERRARGALHQRRCVLEHVADSGSRHAERACSVSKSGGDCCQQRAPPHRDVHGGVHCEALPACESDRIRPGVFGLAAGNELRVQQDGEDHEDVVCEEVVLVT